MRGQSPSFRMQLPKIKSQAVGVEQPISSLALDRANSQNLRFATNLEHEKEKVFTIVEEVTKENFFKREKGENESIFKRDKGENESQTSNRLKG